MKRIGLAGIGMPVRRLALALCLLTGQLAAGQEEFNGRWVMQAQTGDRRVFWLELTGAGTASLQGWFYGATGGRLARLLSATIERGELRFEVRRDFGSPQAPRVVLAVTTARLSGKGLRGVTSSQGGDLQWTGWKAAEIADRDDGTWHEGTPVNLFDGKGLSHWKAFHPGRLNQWPAQDGILRNTEGADYLASNETFWNFKLRLEYRVPQDSNSGIGLRGRYELQILGDHGQPPDIHGNGAIYSRLRPAVNASKPGGEWQTLEARLIGREVTVALNGVTIIGRKTIEGLCGMASDPYEDRPGPITLQGDHGPIEIRAITVTPLVR